MKRRGSALVEVMIAGLLIAIVATASVSALFTGARNNSRIQAHEDAALAVSHLLADLRNYVTAETAASEDAPGDPPGSWHLPGDACGSCYALSEGEHDVKARLPEDLRLRFGATLRYTVVVENINDQDVQRVQARMDWSNPP